MNEHARMKWPERGRTTAEAGLLNRRAVRMTLDYLCLDWKEYKGWLSSYFIVEGKAEDVQRFREWMKKNGAEPL
jgi:hypothetical protein